MAPPFLFPYPQAGVRSERGCAPLIFFPLPFIKEGE